MSYEIQIIEKDGGSSMIPAFGFLWHLLLRRNHFIVRNFGEQLLNKVSSVQVSDTTGDDSSNEA